MGKTPTRNNSEYSRSGDGSASSRPSSTTVTLAAPLKASVAALEGQVISCSRGAEWVGEGKPDLVLVGAGAQWIRAGHELQSMLGACQQLRA